MEQLLAASAMVTYIPEPAVLQSPAIQSPNTLTIPICNNFCVPESENDPYMHSSPNHLYVIPMEKPQIRIATTGKSDGGDKLTRTRERNR